MLDQTGKITKITKITKAAGLIAAVLAAATLSGCGIFGSILPKGLAGGHGQKKALKAYQEFLEKKVPRNEIYGDMIFSDKSGDPLLAVLYVDDATEGFDNAHFDLYGYEGGEVERIAAFDPIEEAREDGGEILDIIYTDGIIRTRVYDGRYNPTNTFYQIDGNELTPVYASYFNANTDSYEVTIGSGKNAVDMILETEPGASFETFYPEGYDRAMEDLYKEIYDGKYEWNDYARYMLNEHWQVPAYSGTLGFLDDEGVYDFEGHTDAWYALMDENGYFGDLERNLSRYLMEEGPMDDTHYLLALYNNSRAYRDYGTDGIFDFTLCILARDPRLADQIDYARSDEEEYAHAILYYEQKFGNK